jgi:hypothetical protein
MANILDSCLCYKCTGLLSHPTYGAIIKSHEDGYHAYSALAALGGHPNLYDYTSELVMPQQAPDMSLVDHAWPEPLVSLTQACPWQYILVRPLLHPSILGIFPS